MRILWIFGQKMLWKFFWPNDNIPVYFEYEISPMNYELPILISKEEEDLVRWRPFHYDEGRKTRYPTSVKGVRFEQLIDGIENYEKIRIFKE